VRGLTEPHRLLVQPVPSLASPAARLFLTSGTMLFV